MHVTRDKLSGQVIVEHDLDIPSDPTWEECGHCNGSGLLLDRHPAQTCPTCDGHGGRYIHQLPTAPISSTHARQLRRPAGEQPAHACDDCRTPIDCSEHSHFLAALGRTVCCACAMGTYQVPCFVRFELPDTGPLDEDRQAELDRLMAWLTNEPQIARDEPQPTVLIPQ